MASPTAGIEEIWCAECGAIVSPKMAPPESELPDTESDIGCNSCRRRTVAEEIQRM